MMVKWRHAGHEARQCPNLVCFNCDALGHVSLECNAGDKCSVCKDHDHFAASCPLLNEWSRDAPVDDCPEVSFTSQSVSQESQPSVEPSSWPGSSSSSSSSGSSSDSSSSNLPLPELFDEPG